MPALSVPETVPGLTSMPGTTVPVVVLWGDSDPVLPVKAGEALLLHNHLWHRSGTNRTAGPRRAVTICVMSAGILQGELQNLAHRRDKRAGVGPPTGELDHDGVAGLAEAPIAPGKPKANVWATAVVVLVILWLLGYFGGRKRWRGARSGNLVHLLLVIASLAAAAVKRRSSDTPGMLRVKRSSAWTAPCAHSTRVTAASQEEREVNRVIPGTLVRFRPWTACEL